MEQSRFARGLTTLERTEESDLVSTLARQPASAVMVFKRPAAARVATPMRIRNASFSRHAVGKKSLYIGGELDAQQGPNGVTDPRKLAPPAPGLLDGPSKWQAGHPSPFRAACGRFSSIPARELRAGGYGLSGARYKLSSIADRGPRVVIVHLVDGTYELFRHFYGLRRFTKGADKPLGAVAGVLTTVLQMLEEDATHLGVATDHVVESFRNALWSGYKTGDGIEPRLRAQFEPLEEALCALGIAVWPMQDLEADDALATAARIAGEDPQVEQVRIWTPDKDLAQCVRGDRIVQVDRRSRTVRDENGVRARFGVEPRRIPDYLALVGDNADGYPGLEGIGPKRAAALIASYGPIEGFPPDVLGERRDLALLFKDLATLRTQAPIRAEAEETRWRGPTGRFADWTMRLGAPKLLARARTASEGVRRRSIRA